MMNHYYSLSLIDCHHDSSTLLPFEAGARMGTARGCSFGAEHALQQCAARQGGEEVDCLGMGKEQSLAAIFMGENMET